MNCPNINIKSVINEFNDIIAAFGGQPMTIEEFRSKDVRNMRSGVDNSAMQIAYYVWDKTNGEGLAALPEYINSVEEDDMQRIRNVVNNMLGIKKGSVSSPVVNAEIKAISLLQSENADKMFKKGAKNGWTLDKTLNEIGGFAGYKQLFNPEDLSKKVSELDREQLTIDVAGKYGYNIEINAAKKEYYEEVIYDQDTDEYFGGSLRDDNTSYYSNLTVPGGTNYTENELSTPLITPSIKGHAQFSTNNGIGWFRSDDKVAEGTQPKLTKEEALQRAIGDDRFLPFDTDGIGGIPTKTLRILEIQSDLFQKGRDRNLLAGYNIGTVIETDKGKFKILDVFKKAILDNQGREVGIEEVAELENLTTGAKGEVKTSDIILKTGNKPENQFLQLLNKDNNWVTFFIKSIVQDSAKKGYEKVLFPKGETAAKIEGHETIADEIRRIDRQIEELNTRGLTTEDSELPFLENGKLTRNKEEINKEIKRLEGEKSNLKSQGIEKLKPIEAFYEIKVGNILEKQFGKDSIKTITDEYGNQWREVSISPADLDVIKFEKEDVVDSPLGTVKSRAEIYEEEMSRYNKGMESVRRKHGLSDGESIVMTPALFARLTKIYTKGDYPFMFFDTGERRTDKDYYGQKDFLVKLILKPEYKTGLNNSVERRYLSQFPDGKAPEVEPISRKEMLEIANEDQNIVEDAPQTQIQARGGTQLNMLDKLFQFKSNEPGRPSKRSIRVLSKLANRLYERFGIKFEVVTAEEASDIVKMSSRRSMARNEGVAETTKGLYDSSTKTAYLILDRFDSNTTVHEIFGHPFLDIIKSTPELRPLYNKLAIEAAKDSTSIGRVANAYATQTDATKADEAILLAMKKYIDGMSTNDTMNRLIYRFYEIITEFLNKAFGKSDFIKSIRPAASLESIARWAVFGTDKVNLIGGDQGQAIQSTMNSIAGKFKGVKYDGSERSIASFDDMMRIAGLECSQCIFETAEEAGITTSEQIIEAVMARLRHTNFRSSTIRNQDGSVAATFKWHTDGQTIFIDSIQPSKGISMTAAFMSIVNGIKGRSEVKLAIMANSEVEGIYNSISDYLMLSPLSYALVRINGVEHLVVSNQHSGYNDSIMFEKAYVDNDALSMGEVKEFIKETSDGLKSQLKEMERKGTFTISEMERVRSVIDDIDNLNEVEGILSFISHAGSEVAIMNNRIKDLKGKMVANELIDQGELQSIKRNFFSLYNHAIRSVSAIRLGTSILSKLPKSDQERFDSSLQYVKDRISEIESSIAALSKYAYINELKKIGLKAGSTTIDDNIIDVYNEDSDITTVGSFIFGLSKSSKEPLRALAKIVNDVKSEVAMEMEVGEFGNMFNELTSMWKKIKSKNKFATYSRIMEKVDGKDTGFLISDLLYGKFRHDYKKFRAGLQVKYKLRNENDRPTDRAAYYAYMDEVNEWLSKHVERRFKPEYYKAKSKLSIEAREALEAVNDAISSFLKKNDLLDENGLPATEKMSQEQKKMYKDLKKAKTSLAMDRNPDGTPKLEGSEAWNIAKELAAFNEEISKNVKYKANQAAFKAKYDKLKTTLSPEELIMWENDNLKVQYKKEFWDALDKADMAHQTKEWQNAYNERSAILKMYRDADTMEISGEQLDAMEYTDPNTGKLTSLGERIKYLDVWLSDNSTKSKNKKSNFNALAESVPTAEYKAMEAEALSANDPAVYEEFIAKTSYATLKGKMVRYSQYSKVEPIDKDMIEIVPNSMWSELDTESNYANPEYNEAMAEDGMQPKRSMYDNSAAYNEVMRDPDWAAFRNKIRETYRLANKKYTYLHNPNSLQLAQIPGGYLRRAMAYDNILKGLVAALYDNFVVRSYDTGFGDYESRGAFRADGSPTMFVPTRYRTLLDNPSSISKDLLGSLALYVKSAVNYNLMTKKEDAIATILDGVANTRVKGAKGDKALFVRAGETKMYKAAKDYVESNVYDRAGNAYDFFVKSWADPNVRYRVSAAKPIVKFLNYVRKINLSFNVRAILTNLIGAELHLRIEKNLGSTISKQSMRFANYEFARHLPKAMESTINRTNDKVISLMRMFAIVRSNEADMKDLHGSKLTHFMLGNIHYGPYSAGDFAVKGRMMIAYMANIKLYNGKFYSRDQFANEFYPSKRSEGYDIFDNIQENLYGVFEIDRNGMLTIKDEYRDIVNSDLLSSVSSAMNVLARKLDGTMSGAEKTRMHNDAFAQALLLHRGWLLNAISERFHSKIYDYEKQMLISGMYKKENVSTAFKMMARFIGQKVSDLRHLNMKGIVSRKFGSIEDRYESGQVYQAKRLIRELGMLLSLATITTMLGRMVPLEGDDDDEKKKKEDTWQMWAYVISLRTSMEFFALYSPADVYKILGNPTAAEGSMKNIEDTFGFIFDGSYDDVIESGRYKYKTKLHRSIIKGLPGVKQFYENFVAPDLGAIEEFTMKNLPAFIPSMQKVISPMTQAEKDAKDIRKYKLEIREAKEKARKEAGLE